MQSYSVQAQSSAEPAVIYAMLLDGPAWPDWMEVDRVIIERAATEASGEVRQIVSGRHVSFERVVGLETDRRFTYVNESPPFSFYLGEIILARPEDRQTSITWSASFSTRPALLAWPMKLYLRRFMQRTVNSLAREAEKAANGHRG